MRLSLALAVAALALWSEPTLAAPIKVVVAENFYGEPVMKVGGADVAITAILKNPDADPHDFEPPPSVAKAVADADIVIYNGIDYDPWMDRLIAASRSQKRTVINVGLLLKRVSGDNPHLWYDPAAMPALTDAVVRALSAALPAGSAGYVNRGAAYKTELAAITARIDQFKGRYAGQPVTATEPVFGYMADALGLEMRNVSFQRAAMNGTEPSAKDIAAMEADLRGAKVKVLFYNSRVADEETVHLKDLAQAARVPIVGVTETKPADQATYIQWMLSEIDATEKALAGTT